MGTTKESERTSKEKKRTEKGNQMELEQAKIFPKSKTGACMVSGFTVWQDTWQAKWKQLSICVMSNMVLCGWQASEIMQAGWSKCKWFINGF